MKTLSKFVVGLGLAGALAIASAAPASAQRWRHEGPVGAAAGFVGGLALGAASVATSPFNGGYSYGPPATYGYEYGYGYPQTEHYQGVDRLHNSVANF
jgi:hypothetical protein